jgi:hypothetical protein
MEFSRHINPAMSMHRVKVMSDVGAGERRTFDT